MKFWTRGLWPFNCSWMTLKRVSIWLTSQIHYSYTYLLLVYLGDDAFETLWIFFLWHVSSFYSNYRKHAMPFNNNIAFIDGGILWAFAIDVDWLYVSTNLLMNASTCFYWNQWRLHLHCFCLCLRSYSCKRIKFSTFASHDCALQTFWAPLDSREASSSRPPFFADSADFEDLKVCINGFGTVSSCYTQSKAV